MSSDTALVIQAQLHRNGAFDELVRRHYSTAWQVARRFTALPEDADDLVQEALVTAYERLEQLQQPESFAGWLLVIVRNKGLMWRRKRLSQPALFSLEGDEEDVASHLVHASFSTALATARQEEVRDAVARALTKLPPQQRQTVHLFYREGYGYRETALLLNATESTIRGSLARARSSLRKELVQMTSQHTTCWTLEQRDLDALRDAANYAINPAAKQDIPKADETIQVLNTIYLDGKAHLIATDSHGLFCYTSPSLGGIPAQLFHADLGRKLRDDFPRATRAELSFTDTEATLKLQEGGIIHAPLVDRQFPTWENVVPKGPHLAITASHADWRRELEMLESVRSSGFIQDSNHRLVIVVNPGEDSLILREGSFPKPEGAVAREVSVTLPAQFDIAERFVFAMSAELLARAVNALRIAPDDSVEMRLISDFPMIIIQSPQAPGVFSLTMPLRLEYDPEGHKVDLPKGNMDYFANKNE